MTENEGKYRRWAWGAVLGLAAVIIIAGIVVAVSLSSTPKPSTAKKEPQTTNEQPKTVAAETKKEEKTETKTETKKETQDEVIKNHINPDHSANSTTNSTSKSSASAASNMPKTGPEDAILPIFALAISGALVAYNVTLAKKSA